MTTIETAIPLQQQNHSLASLVEREARRRRRKRMMWWGSLALVPVIAFVAWFIFHARPVPFSARFRMQKVAQGDLTREVRATGNVEAVTMIQVGAEISGRIATVEVDYNAHVKAGQVLARFDRTSLLAQLAQSEATLAAARSALEQSKTDRDHAITDLKRADGLYAQKVLSNADHDAATTTARLAEQRVTSAQANLAAQLAVYKVARTNLDHGIIYAPIDGIVIARNIDPGQTVASVFQTPVLFSVAADLRKMRVVAATDEADIGELREGQRATFTVNAYPDRVFNGVVTQVRNAPAIVQDVVTYGTVVEVDNADFTLKPGMTASVHIYTDSAKNVLSVPNTALSFTPPGEKKGEGAGVWILDSNAVHRIAVRSGMSDGESTQIAPGTLTAGANVITELTPEGRKVFGNGN